MRYDDLQAHEPLTAISRPPLDHLLRLQASNLGGTLRNCALGLAAAATLCLPMSMVPSPVRLRAHVDHSQEHVTPDSAT